MFGYPGGKTYLADWIISHFPDHHCYIEPFGGAGSVLVSKPESGVEIYNDRDGDIVHFFRILRERPDDLEGWLRNQPYAKDLHEKYARQYYSGYRPDDDIERAGRFFYLRHSQFAGKYNGYSGYSSSSARNVAGRYYRGVDGLGEFSDRLRHVQIENRDYRELFDRFDGPEVLWYCDPPYVEEGDDLYTGEDFDHLEFCNHLIGLDGYWCVSYTDLPDPLTEYTVVERSAAQQMRNGQPDKNRDERVERLVMNYDPKETALFHSSDQQTLSDTIAATDGGSE